MERSERQSDSKIPYPHPHPNPQLDDQEDGGIKKKSILKPLTLPLAPAMTEGSQRLSRVSISRKTASCCSISCSSLLTSSSTCFSSPAVNRSHTLTEPSQERQRHVVILTVPACWPPLPASHVHLSTEVTPWLDVCQSRDCPQTKLFSW